MRKQSNTLNFEGQNIYVGIDVHLKSWTVSILSDHLHHKTFVQPPSPEALSSYLHAHFPNGNYLSPYEAGFSGFWAHYKLVEMGIQNIVVNPADVSTSQKERLQKTDAVDSRKIARSLRSNELTAIHVPCRETLEVRTLLRSRGALVRDLARMKQRVKAFLYYYGIDYREADLCDSSCITEKVFVSTVHKAKGLEFEKVIIFEATDGVYPFFDKKTPEEIRESARLFYVAMTRAKKRLHITYAESVSGISKWGTPYSIDKEPTPFLRHIKKYFYF